MSALSNNNNESTFTLSERLESKSGHELANNLEPKVNGSVGLVGFNHPPKISFAISKPPEHVKLGDDDAENLQKIATQKSSTSIESIVAIKTEPTETNTLEANNTNNNVGSTGENKKKRKRSRWDQAGTTTVQETPAPSIDLKSIQSANAGGAVNPTPSQQSYTFSDKRKFVKYSDTYKSGMVRIGSKWVYPEDEITDGGTWEHKKRAEEMKKTAEQAALLTSHAEAKRAHHIADFLPKEELEKFEQKVKAIKTGGTTPTYEDYASNKLDQSNIGFKMLMKQGWQAGSGLGKSGEGISAPINKADSRPANAGLGQTKPEGVDEEDDEFEIYRKRMMLAYRFRPNPLNNPRRPYY
ncbi:4550_t:CDS:2 [Funneliformis geosporum]|nr:4550_t:CDS:2 [Funneliformis geosporum]